MRRCSRVNCTEKPEYECLCRNESKFFCVVDLVNHVSDTTVIHNHYPIIEEIDVNVRRVIVSALIKCISELVTQKNQILKDLSECISSIEQRAKRVILDLQKQQKELETAVKTILESPQALQESKLKASLNLPLSKAKEEVKQWKFTSLTLDSKEIKSGINNWVIVQNKFNTLFSLSQPDSSHNSPAPAARSVNSQQANLSSNRIDPTSILTCERDHRLAWSTTVAFKYYITKNDFWVECRNCFTQYTCSGWHCDECNYDLCETCGLNLGVPSPKLKCNQNHELLWRPDANSYYKSLGRKPNFTCKECNRVKDEVHWNCRACQYDICQSCGTSNHKQQPFSTKVTCKNNHSLQKIQNVSDQLGLLIRFTNRCSCCKSVVPNDIYTCQTCDYFLCESCYRYFNSPTAGHTTLRCQKKHSLRWVIAERFLCDYCNQTFTDEHYKCRECEFDVCDKCADILLIVFIKPIIRVYGPNKIPLIWIENIGTAINRGNSVTCNLCRVSYLKVGMFCSNDREYNLCLLCYNDPQRPKPQLRNSITDADSLALNLISSLLRKN